MTKLISISVWGDNPRYVIGAKRQVHLAKKLLPEWNVIIFTDKKSNYVGTDAKIIQVDDNSHGAFWRFLPFFDSEDNIVASRDADSRISVREARAMQEWVNSDKGFHTIRDHEAHLQFPVMAGLFGIKGKLPSQIKDVMIERMTNHNYYLNDQHFLRDITPILHNLGHMCHSFAEPGWFSDTRKTLLNPYSFCGNGYDENDMPIYAPTLKECESFDSQKVNSKYKFDEGVHD